MSDIQNEDEYETNDTMAEQIRQRAFDRQAAKEREARRVSRQMGDSLDDR